MLLVHYFSVSIIIIHNMQGNLAQREVCTCSCENKVKICDNLERLKYSVDANVADRVKWNEHFQFVQNLHARWEDGTVEIFSDDLKSVPEQIPESENSSSDVLEDIINGSKAIRSISVWNEEVENKISNLKTRLHSVEDLSALLRSDLRSEQETRKRLEEDSKQISILESRNEELALQISSFERKLSRAEMQAAKFHLNLEKERKVREDMQKKFSQLSKMKDRNRALKDRISRVEAKLKLEENLSQNFEFNLQKLKEAEWNLESGVKNIAKQFEVFRNVEYAKRTSELEKQVTGFGEKLSTVDSEVAMVGNELIKEHTFRKDLQVTILSIETAIVKIFKLLGGTLLAKGTDESTEIHEILLLFEAWKADYAKWLNDESEKPNLSFRNRTTNSEHYHASSGVNWTLKTLQNYISELNDSLADIKRIIPSGVDKKRNLISSRERNHLVEVIEPHERIVPKRTFNPHIDP